MLLRKLQITNFRLFPNIEVEFKDGINIITGMNGQGKTSILEAIYYLALTRSFRTTSDQTAIRTDCHHFDINGLFFTSEDNAIKVRLYYSQSEGKNLFIKDNRITYFSEFIGMIPCVVLTLADTRLVQDGPAERRKFLDILLSQVSSVYLNALKKYKRVLYQRNILLSRSSSRNFKDQLTSWNTQLIENGAVIIYSRRSFIAFLNEHISSYYQQLSKKSAEISAAYVSSIGTLPQACPVETIQQIYQQTLEDLADAEVHRQTTLVGPHRDEMHLFYNLKPFKEYCSQGEVKTLIIVLKLLEWEYIRNQREIKPILLLDDIFGELDVDRMQRLLAFIKTVGQSHITTTLSEKFKLSLADKVLIVKEKNVYDA
jgi:DNA replication and repair protein RecF